MDKLYLVDLSNNQIERIHGKAFHNMRSVQILILNNNNLKITNPQQHQQSNTKELDSNSDNSSFTSMKHSESLHPRMFGPLRNLEELHLCNAFNHDLNQSHNNDNDYSSSKLIMSALDDILQKSNLTTLKVLNLESNHLTTVGQNEHLFCSLPSLQHLRLAHNRLRSYQINASCLQWLSSVDVSDNTIETIPYRSIELIRSSPSPLSLGNLHLNISYNPFRCDCELVDFFRFVKDATSEQADPSRVPKLEAMNQYQCAPRTTTMMDIKGKYFDDLNEQDLIDDCRNKINKQIMEN